MKSIKTKMTLTVCLLVAISLSIVGGTVSYLMYTSSLRSLEKTMTETAIVAADLVREYMQNYQTVAAECGTVARLSDPEKAVSEKKVILDAKVKQYGFLAGNIADASGKGVLYNADIADRDYFQAAMKGKTGCSNVLLSRSLDKYTVVVAAPLWAEGLANTHVVGCVYFDVDVTELSTLMSKINVGDTGSAYMLDKDNFTIAHKNADLVLQRDNTLDALPENPSLQPLADLEAKMTAGEQGFGTYSYAGVRKLLAYAPVQTGQGWSLAVNADLSEFLQSTYTAIGITLALVIIGILAGCVVSLLLASSIARPVVDVAHTAAELAKGNFDVELSYTSRDEVGHLAHSMRRMIATTKGIITDTSRGLSEMANGNFDIAPQVEYIGAYSEIEKAIQKIIGDLSGALSQIMIATDQISSGSDQVSGGAQALAQGTTEQASSVQELSASLSEVVQQIQSNAGNAAAAAQLATQVGGELNASNAHMSDMLGAMSEISLSSEQIGKIIKTIEDIAFQTNILALNAAVEAARAGAAGKGFAVVADEVRNLATKSSEAAKQTNTLIESSVKSVAGGVKIANQTAGSLSAVVKSAQEIIDLLAKISAASAEQSTSIAQIDLGVGQISAVVQTNSATSEESAAASEELNGQALAMKALVSRFRIAQKDGADGIDVGAAAPFGAQSAPKASDFGLGGAKY